MEVLKVTPDFALRFILFKACKIPKVGTLVSSLSLGELIEAEEMFSPEELRAFKMPLWIFSGCGSGYGTNYGAGLGHGYGFGADGYGSGYGYGHVVLGKYDGHGDVYGGRDGDRGWYGYGDGKDVALKILEVGNGQI